MKPQPLPARPEDICPKCRKTLLGCRLNKRLNRPMWLVLHKVQPVQETR